MMLSRTRTITFVLLGSAMLASAVCAQSQTRSDDQPLLARAQAGAVDVCAAERLGLLMLPRDSLEEMRAQLQSLSGRPFDHWVRSDELRRIVGLQDTIASALAAPSSEDWTRAHRAAREQVQDWRDEAEQSAGPTAQAAVRELMVWQRARSNRSALAKPRYFGGRNARLPACAPLSSCKATLRASCGARRARWRMARHSERVDPAIRPKQILFAAS